MKGFEGNTILLGQNLNITKDSKISFLKNCISNRTGIPFKNILLIYTTKQMGEEADEFTLADYGIQNESTLMMVGRLRGGSTIIDLRIRL